MSRLARSRGRKWWKPFPDFCSASVSTYRAARTTRTGGNLLAGPPVPMYPHNLRISQISRQVVSSCWCVLYPRSAQSILLSAGAILAVVLAQPGIVRAECGDYMLRGGNAPVAVHAVLPPTHRAPAIPVEPAGPCHGPHCSRGVPVPVVPVTAPSISTPDWACVLCSKITLANVVARYLVGPSCPLQARHVLAIYHPPRHS